jgi:hypothetical protein
MRSTTKMVAVLIAVLALLAAACGSASDTAAENLAEKLVEASSDGDVDVNISGDGDDVTIEMETEDGSVSIGVGTELPDGLDIPVPDGGDVMTSITADEVISVSLTYDQARYDELVGFYENWTSGSGDEWETQTMSIDAGEGIQRSTIFSSEAGDSFVMVGDCFSMESEGGELDAACVTINQGG